MSKPPMVFDPASHTGAGRSKRRPPPRPAGDSVYKPCEVGGCGGVGRYPGGDFDPLPVYVMVWDGPGLWFCSWGCAGRFCAIQEVRQ